MRTRASVMVPTMALCVAFSVATHSAAPSPAAAAAASRSDSIGVRAAPFAIPDPIGSAPSTTGSDSSVAQVPSVEWERVAPGGEAPDRALHGMVYDPVNEAFWSFGGVEADAESNQFRSDLFRLDATDRDAKWSRVRISGLRPPPVAFHTLTYDPNRHRLIVYGGLHDRQGTSSQKPADGNTLWLLDLADLDDLEWQRESVHGNPTDRFAHAAVFVPTVDALVVSGGAETFDRSTSSHYALLLGEEPKRWERMASAGFSARAGHSLVYDEAGARLLVYGGVDDLGNLRGTRDTVALDLSGGLTGSRQWTRLSTATPGLARGLMAAAFDPVSRLWWVHGGVEANGRFLRDLSVLDLKPARPVWTRTQVVYNGPLERFGHTAALDATRGRILFQGGTPDNAITLRDTRSLAISPLPTPTASAPPTVNPTSETPEPTEPSATASSTASPTGGTVEPTVETPSPTRGATATSTATTPATQHEIYMPHAARGQET